MEAAVRQVAKTHIRSQRAGLLVLVLVAALGASVTLAAAAAARRSSSALGRAIAEERTADVAIDVRSLDDERLARAGGLPGVTDLSAVAFTALQPAGSDLHAGIDLVGLAPLDDRAGQTMDRLRVVEGRRPDATQADEAVLDPGLADRLGLNVGDDLTLESFTQAQIDQLFVDPDAVQPDGPTFTVRVVGLVHSLEEVTSDNQGRFGIVGLSAAGWRVHGTPDLPDVTDPERTGMGAFRVQLRARLTGDASRFVDDLGAVFGRELDATFSQSRPDVIAAADDPLDVEALALTVVAVGAGAAALLAVAQAAARLAASATAADRRALDALGLRRAEQVAAGVLPVVAATAVGAVAGAALAVAASPLARFGMTERIEVDRGVVTDPVVLAAGTVVLVGVVTVVAVLAAQRSPGRAGLAPPNLAIGPLPLAIGTSTARAGGRWSVLASVAAVTGITAVAVFGASFDRLVATPRLYGFGWDDSIVLQADDEEIATTERPRLVADDRIDALAQYRIFELSFGGDHRIGGLALRRVKSEVGPIVLDGRLPIALDEIAVDPDALPGDGPQLGDVLRTPDLSEDEDLTVVGLLTGTGLGEFVVTPGTADRLHAQPSEGGFLLSWADGTDIDAARRELATRFAEVEPARPTAEVQNLRHVQDAPVALGAFFVLIGLATIGHTLASTARQRRRDLAVTRALGFTRGQAIGVLLGEGLTIGIVGLLTGLVLGGLLGRLVWHGVADAVRFVPDVVLSPLAVLAVVIGTLVGLVAVGWLVARRVVVDQPGPTLRDP